MVDFVEIRLDLGIDYGEMGGPLFNTDISVRANGTEDRNSNWPEQKGEWEIGDRTITNAEKNTILAVFCAIKGKGTGFRFKAWLDFEATQENIGTCDAVTTQYPLTKTYVFGPATTIRTITKPVTGTVKIYFDGVEQLSGWTLDYTTGILTFSAAPGNGVVITWSGEFDTPVRFDTDHFQAQFDAMDPNTGEKHFYLPSMKLVGL